MKVGQAAALFGGSNTCNPSCGPSQVVCLQQALVNPTVQLWIGFTDHWHVPTLLAMQENGSPQVTWKLCFKSLQGPSTTLLLCVNMHGDGLYSSPQAKQWELVSDCVAQSSPSQINKSYYKISHWLKVCISSGAAALATCSGIWMGEEHFLVNKVKTVLASSQLPASSCPSQN